MDGKNTAAYTDLADQTAKQLAAYANNAKVGAENQSVFMALAISVLLAALAVRMIHK